MATRCATFQTRIGSCIYGGRQHEWGLRAGCLSRAVFKGGCGSIPITQSPDVIDLFSLGPARPERGAAILATASWPGNLMRQSHASGSLPKPRKQARYRGGERQAKRPEQGRVAVVAAQRTGAGGAVRPKRPTGKATARQSVPRAGTRGETVSAPTLTPARQWTAEGSRGSA